MTRLVIELNAPKTKRRKLPLNSRETVKERKSELADFIDAIGGKTDAAAPFVQDASGDAELKSVDILDMADFKMPVEKAA